MKHHIRLAVIFFFTFQERVLCDPEFCKKGEEIASRYSQCWAQSLHLHKNPELEKKVDVITAKFVESYATYMCSEVKPDALKCLRDEIKECSKAEKMMATADESGGTCEKNKLNPDFKLAIIDLLPSVRTDSPCFNISSNSSCYNDAVHRLIDTEVDITRFYYHADRIFRETWECLIRLFKSHLDICKNWQIPMLLSLQHDVMPSLYGLKLTHELVDMLDLQKPFPPTKTTTPSTKDCDEENRNKFYLLLRVLSQKPDPVQGDIVFHVSLDTAPEEVKNSFRNPGIENKSRSQNKKQKIKKEKSGKKQTENTGSW